MFSFVTLELITNIITYLSSYSVCKMVERRLYMTKLPKIQCDGHERVVSEESLSGVNSQIYETISLIQCQKKRPKTIKIKMIKINIIMECTLL